MSEEICVYEDCDNKAEYTDLMSDPICRDCKERDIKENGYFEDDFEPI